MDYSVEPVILKPAFETFMATIRPLSPASTIAAVKNRHNLFLFTAETSWHRAIEGCNPKTFLSPSQLLHDNDYTDKDWVQPLRDTARDYYKHMATVMLSD